MYRLLCIASFAQQFSFCFFHGVACIRNIILRVPFMFQWLMNSNSIPGPTKWFNDHALLWLWYRLAAIAPLGPLAWEPPHDMGVALKGKNNQKTNKKAFQLGGLRDLGTCRGRW